MTVKRKILVAVFAVILIALAGAGAYLFLKQRDIAWQKTSESGLKARELCHFAEAEKELQVACLNAEHFELSDERRYSSNLALAELYLAIGDFAKADAYIDKARVSAEIQNNVQNKLKVLGLRAEAFSREAKFDDCRIAYEEMAELAKKTKETTFEIDALFGLANLNILFLKRLAAEEIVEQIDALSMQLDEKTEYGILLSVYSAALAEQKGRYKTVLMLLEDATNVVEHRERPSSSLELLLYNRTAAHYVLARNYVRANYIAKRVLENSDKDFDSYLAGYSLEALRTLASAHLELNDERRARHFIDREIDEVGRRLSPAHPYYGVALQHRALVEGREGKVDESRQDFKAAQDIFVKVFGEKNRFSADTLSDMAKLESEKNNLDSAANLCRQSLSMYKQLLPYDHPSSLKVTLLLSQIYKRQGKDVMANALEREAGQGISASEGK